jgi:hypothetical protein
VPLYQVARQQPNTLALLLLWCALNIRNMEDAADLLLHAVQFRNDFPVESNSAFLAVALAWAQVPELGRQSFLYLLKDTSSSISENLVQWFFDLIKHEEVRGYNMVCC